MGDQRTDDIEKKVWSNAYTVINHINNIIQHAEEGGENEFKHSKLYLGEALALRAMIHFDLVRYFGAPLWASEDLKAKAIPYVSKYTFSVTPYSSLDEVFELVIADLTRAESLMTEDSSLIPETRTNSSDGFTDARITHMNLYAVEALLARVYWTRGDLSNAAIYAQKVIDSKKFSFRPLSTFVQSDGGTLDLNETIFGFYSESSQSTNSKRYGITGTSATFSLASDWKVLYEDNAGDVADYRINSWFDNTENRLKKTVNSSVANGAGYSGNRLSE